MMEFWIGVFLALGVSVFGWLVGFDRDRSFYPVMMVVIASTYGLFAVIGGSMSALRQESIWIAGFIFAAVIGYKRNVWIVVGALFFHGVFDFFHGHVVGQNPGVPVWWPVFCLSYDVTAAGYLAAMIVWRKGRAGAVLPRSA